MAIVRVSSFMIQEWLFKGLDVEIRDARMSLSGGVLELSIRGKDVPDEAEVDVICTKYDNPGADPFTTVEIRGRREQPRPSAV